MLKYLFLYRTYEKSTISQRGGAEGDSLGCLDMFS